MIANICVYTHRSVYFSYINSKSGYIHLYRGNKNTLYNFLLHNTIYNLDN